MAIEKRLNSWGWFLISRGADLAQVRCKSVELFRRLGALHFHEQFRRRRVPEGAQLPAERDNVCLRLLRHFRQTDPRGFKRIQSDAPAFVIPAVRAQPEFARRINQMIPSMHGHRPLTATSANRRLCHSWC